MRELLPLDGLEGRDLSRLLAQHAKVRGEVVARNGAGHARTAMLIGWSTKGNSGTRRNTAYVQWPTGTRARIARTSLVALVMRTEPTP